MVLFILKLIEKIGFDISSLSNALNPEKPIPLTVVLSLRIKPLSDSYFIYWKL